MDRLSEQTAPNREWHALQACAFALEPAQRARVAERWSAAAQYEHASIASFDRFALQLLALGAPPSLIVGAHRAALDEVEHAQLSFRIASIYAGRPLGPGALPIDASLFADMSLERALAEAVEEGCVGETLAATHAELLMQHVQSSVLRSAFAIVQRDEANHAALAFSFVRWGLQRHGQPARQIVEQSFETAIAKVRAAASDGASEPWLMAHGQLDDGERARANLRALADVVEPARGELFAVTDPR